MSLDPASKNGASPQQVSLHVNRWGTGPEWLIALHGYQQDHRQWQRWSTSLAARFQVLAVDLPWHGQTQWPSEPLDLDAWGFHLQQILPEPGAEYWIAGFSLGARLALHTLPRLSHPPKGILLLAPDGFGNPWVDVLNHLPLSIRQSIGRWMTQNPKAFLNVVRTASRLLPIAPWQLRFLQAQFQTPATRQRFFNTWYSLNYLKPFDPSIREFIRQQSIVTHLIYGLEDRLIQPRRITQWAKDHPQTHLWPIANAGHQLPPEVLEEIL